MVIFRDAICDTYEVLQRTGLTSQSHLLSRRRTFVFVKQISNSTRSDQPFQKLIYAVRYSQLSITFAAFDMFVCMHFFYVFACACGLNPAFGCQKKINVVLVLSRRDVIGFNSFPCEY